MHKALTAVAGLTALAFVGCAAGTAMDGIGAEAMQWNGSLQANPGYELVAANVNASSNAGGTSAGISIVGLEDGAVHPWHIHEGACGSAGEIVGDPEAYPVLRAGMDGTASATAQVRPQLQPGGTYSVNVHASPTNLGEIVGCAPLR